MGQSRVGKALERAIGTGEQPSSAEPRSKAHMMNPVRRQVFEYICRFPCTTISRISKGIKRSIHTVQWHVRKLTEAGLVSESRISGLNIFYPLTLLDQQDIPLLILLNDPNAKEAFLYIVENPGCSQSDLIKGLGISHQSAGRVAQKLLKRNLITRVDDGKYRRHYPTDLLVKKREESIGNAKRFKTFVMEKLSSEGLKPEIMRSGISEMLVRIAQGREKAVLKLSCDPYLTVLQ
jgi:predicted transcriptional regulator